MASASRASINVLVRSSHVILHIILRVCRLNTTTSWSILISSSVSTNGMTGQVVGFVVLYGQNTRSTTWTNTVRNRFRQKAGEIEAFRALEIGAAKWRKEHVPRKGNDLNDLTEEGISLLDDMELWWDKQNLLWACHTSRKKDRMNSDGTFRPHQGGAISATFTSDWYLRKGESRDKMGE